jgi:hypothetical protein
VEISGRNLASLDKREMHNEYAILDRRLIEADMSGTGTVYVLALDDKVKVVQFVTSLLCNNFDRNILGSSVLLLGEQKVSVVSLAYCESAYFPPRYKL